MLLGSLLVMIDLLITIVRTVVICQFVLYLLIVFNVLSMDNRFVAALWHALSSILDPLLEPIRRHLPPAGGIDFSYMVLIFGLSLLGRAIGAIAMMSYQ